MAFTIKGLSPESHTNASLAENELDADLFNEYEALFVVFDDRTLALIGFVQSLDEQIQFTDDPTDVLTGSIGVPLVVQVGVTTGIGVIEPFSTVTQVNVYIVSDTTGGGTINSGIVPITVALANGVGTFTAEVPAGAGALTLGLTDSGGSGLDINDVVFINWA